MANPFLVLGGIALSVVTAAFGVLQVPGWVAAAQDAAAANDIAQVTLAQSAALSEHGTYLGSMAELGDSSSVRVSPSGGVRVHTATDPSGKHLLTVARSASGTYFARVDTRPVASATTLEGAVTAAGTTISGATGARVTADGVPLPPALILAETVYENLARDPATKNFSLFHVHPGNTGNAASRSTPVSDWSESGRAYRATWSAATNGVGNVGIGLGAGGLEADKTYTVTFKLLSSIGTTAAQPHLMNDTGGTSEVVAHTEQRTLTAGVPVTQYVTFRGDAASVSTSNVLAFRISQATNTKTVGGYLEIADVAIYEGAHDPSRPWFSGDTIAGSGHDLGVGWTGARDGSASYAYR